MLGRTAGGLYWMFRYLERAENTARLLDAGFRIALTRWDTASDEWASLLATTGTRSDYDARFDAYEAGRVINFMLRDRENASSVLSAFDAARANARTVRTALTREVWEAVNEGWMNLTDLLSRNVRERDLPSVLGIVRQNSALVRGALHGTMLRNDIFNFARLGTFVERADNTARILDVKYYVLLPSVTLVGSRLDNVQWETILRSVSAYRSYKWLNPGPITPRGIADFLILDGRMPRSLSFCTEKIAANLGYLATDYGIAPPSVGVARALHGRLVGSDIDAIIDAGLHEFLVDFLRSTADLGARIETDFRFTG